MARYKTTFRVNCILAAVAYIALGGCISISTPSRPAEWGAVQKTEDECPLVAGSYRDKGEGLKGIASLSLGVLGLARQTAEYEWQPADTVTITGPSEGKLTVEALREGRVIRHKEFLKSASFFSTFMSPHYYKCDGDTVELKTHSQEYRGDMIYSSGQTENVVLQKATDGHLIVMHEWHDGGMILGVFHYTKSQTWFRFEPIDPSGSSSVPPEK